MELLTKSKITITPDEELFKHAVNDFDFMQKNIIIIWIAPNMKKR